MPYNYTKTTCDVCGIQEWRAKGSFRLGIKGEVWCEVCHREKELTDLFYKIDEGERKKS